MIEHPDLGGKESRRRGYAAMAVVALVSVGLVVAVLLRVTGSPATPSGEKADTPRWRWESYRGIELQVPAAWHHGGALGPGWCASTGEGGTRASGSVGRPGVTPAVLCSSPYPPADQRSPSVGFSSTGDVGVDQLDQGWVKETRKIGDVFVTVFTDNDRLRTRIVDSARTVATEDHYGCPPRHRATIGRDFRPAAPTGTVPAADDVASISVCRYLRTDDGHRHEEHGPGAPILSASRLTGPDVTRVLGALDAAPTGTGPNTPWSCGADYAYGDELLILRIQRDTATHDVVVRYHGCDGHGADDGTTLRQLTPDLLQPLLVGPHQPSMLSGAVSQLLATGPK